MIQLEQEERVVELVGVSQSLQHRTHCIIQPDGSINIVIRLRRRLGTADNVCAIVLARRSFRHSLHNGGLNVPFGGHGAGKFSVCQRLIDITTRVRDGWIQIQKEWFGIGVVLDELDGLLGDPFHIVRELIVVPFSIQVLEIYSFSVIKTTIRDL